MLYSHSQGLRLLQGQQATGGLGIWKRSSGRGELYVKTGAQGRVLEIPNQEVGEIY